MVATVSLAPKSAGKTPVAKTSKNAKNKLKAPKVPVSPSGAASSLEDEVINLRAKNKILEETLMAVEESATEQLNMNFELVWFARNRCRYPNHEVSKRLEKSAEHREGISKLRGPDGDFYHGFNSGLLAASRMFKEHVDLKHFRQAEEVGCIHSMVNATAKHKENIDASRKSFPNLNMEDDPEKHQCSSHIPETMGKRR